MATAIASNTGVGVFKTMDEARNVVRELENAGFSRDDISVVANQQIHGADRTEGTSAVAADVGIGAAMGSVGGLLLGFAGLAIPGIGPVLAIGPIVGVLSG